MKRIDLGKISIPLDEYASEGNAILGIRDSGKSYTATAIAERLMDAGIPIIAFDPIGIWRNLRVPGAGKGYEVVVAGGRGGDLPLTARGAQEIVRAAMRENVSLIVDLYDIHLSKADWREVVGSCIRTLLYENGDHGLRHIFIEEAAEFCPQVVAPDQGRVYAEVEKLARMGGNALLGYTLINQRAEQVNKAVLELCDCMILHRQKGRNSITALSKWLDIASAHDSKALISSLPGLAQGECWVWPAGADAPVRTKIPAKNSFHPDRRARQAGTKSGDRAVDVSAFVLTMRTSLEALTKEAEANDPKKLRARIVELERIVAHNDHAVPQEALDDARRDGYAAGRLDAGRDVAKGLLSELQQARNSLTHICESLAMDDPTAEFEPPPPLGGKTTNITRSVIPARRDILIADLDRSRRPAGAAPASAPHTQSRPQTDRKAGNGAAPPFSGLSGPEQRILDAIAWMESIGITDPQQTTVAFLSDYSGPGNGAYKNPRSALNQRGLVQYMADGRIALTDAGRRLARAPASPGTPEELQQRILNRLPGPERKLLAQLIVEYPNAITNDDLARAVGYSDGNNGAYKNPRSRLRALGLVDYPTSGRVVALPVLFIE